MMNNSLFSDFLSSTASKVFNNNKESEREIPQFNTHTHTKTNLRHLKHKMTKYYLGLKYIK